MESARLGKEPVMDMSRFGREMERKRKRWRYEQVCRMLQLLGLHL